MKSINLRALAMALCLGSAVGAVGVLSMAVPAEAGARAAVGRLLQEAIHLAGSGNTSAASEKVREAEGVGSLTAGDQQAIEQTKAYIAAKNGSGATGSKAKFAMDYEKGNYRAVVGEDADELRKAGQYDGESEIVVAQAYYQMGDYATAIRMLRDMHGQQPLELLMSAAYQSHDTEAMKAAAEQLVVSYGQSKYWTNLLTLADSTPGMSPENTMDVYRLRLLTGTMRNDGDYTTAAEVAIQVDCPAEAQGIVQKGIDAKLLTGDRTVRLMTMAKNQAATEAAGLAQEVAAANAAKTGDASIKLAGQYWGRAVTRTCRPRRKPVSPRVLRTATSHRFASPWRISVCTRGMLAVHALNAVANAKPGDTVLAHLWSIYARTH